MVVSLCVWQYVPSTLRWPSRSIQIRWLMHCEDLSLWEDIRRWSAATVAPTLRELTRYWKKPHLNVTNKESANFVFKEESTGSSIPPYASLMEGVWERMIRLVRQILRALCKEQGICDEVLHTVLPEATNILNSRPLTRNSDDPMDDEPLTTNHLVKLRLCSSLPPVVFYKEDWDCEDSGNRLSMYQIFFLEALD